ncbi:MAG: CDP-glycerol glycerophosphotransferase family protein, partial [Sphaerochaetaceae bacterium]|nr:CDP-glycerol glycerophosphotransferase family protein [Sphaerochaetaceae bacterium]
MLFSIAIGFVTMLYFVGKAVLLKLKFLFTGGRYKESGGTSQPVVIYSENSRYWDVFSPVLEYAEKRGYPLLYLTSSQDDPFFQEGFSHIRGEYIGEGNKAFARLNRLEADVCLMTTPGLDVYQLKRSRGVKHYSHILHALSDATTYRLFGLDYFDSVLLTGEFQKEDLRTLEEQRGIAKKDLAVVGCTYLDVLSLKAAYIESQRADKERTVLVAPSWGPSGILSLYGESLLDSLMGTGFRIIVRPHPQTAVSEPAILDSLIKRYNAHDNIEWDFERENLRSLYRADIMISDFSGVIFDYAFLFDRPFLYVNAEFDQRPYDMYDVERDPWQFRILPQIGRELKAESFPYIKEILLTALEDTLLKDNRDKARETAWQCRGQSGKLV